MKNFELVSGNEKCVNFVKINGTTALAKDAKPSGKLLGIVKGNFLSLYGNGRWIWNLRNRRKA